VDRTIFRGVAGCLAVRVARRTLPRHCIAKWLTISDKSGAVPQVFVEACQTALGRPLEPDDDLNAVNTIFAGKVFVVFIGYRKTPSAHGGKFSDELALRRKDERDGLRVHEILSLAL
jgi:hypothetical protein